MSLIEWYKKNRKYTLTVLILSLLFFSLTVITMVSASKNRANLIEIETLRETEHYEKVMSNIFKKFEEIQVFVETIGVDNLTDENCNEFAEKLDFTDTGFISFSIAKDGIMSYYYSYEFDDDLIGRNLLQDERLDVRSSVIYAIENDVIVLNGPFILLHGGEGIVLRKPIFENGEFSAIINLVIRYSELNVLFDKNKSEIINVGVYDNDKANVFGDLNYREDLLYLESIGIENVDWLIGIEVADSYMKRSLSVDIVIITISVFIYSIGLYVGTTIYSKNKNLLEKQKRLIYFDNLTSLPNRRQLNIDVENMIKNNEPFFLGFGDLDNFKNLNDILGHSVGDIYLKDIAVRLGNIISNNISIYRWGGDEFIFLIKTSNKEEAIKYLDSIYAGFMKPIRVKGTDFNASISIGVVTYPQHGIFIDDLIKRADIVMYDIKSQNKNSYGFFENKYIDTLQREVDFEQRVNRYSIEDYEVYLQPILDTDTKEVWGFEALSRLFDKNGKAINIADVVKVLERKGEIPNLDRHVFNTICQYAKEIKRIFNKDFFYTFNVSPLTLTQDFVDFIEAAIKNGELSPKHFIIEIIETIGFSDFESSLRLLNHLKALGFQIAMDDFGMGYSSLSYITKLPLSIIKIDRYFINNYYDNEFDRLLIFAIRDISKSLKLKIIVEGIETTKQLEFIKGIGAHLYQGYIHSKAMSYLDIIKHLKEGF